MMGNLDEHPVQLAKGPHILSSESNLVVGDILRSVADGGSSTRRASRPTGGCSNRRDRGKRSAVHE